MAREQRQPLLLSGQLAIAHQVIPTLIHSPQIYYIQQRNKEFHVSNEWLDFCPEGIVYAQHFFHILELKSVALTFPEIPSVRCCLELHINRCFDHLGFAEERHEYPFINN